MRKHSTALSLAFAAGYAPLGAMAYDVNSVGNLTQSEFRLFSEDMGAALSYKPIIPTEALGVTGFDIGIAGSGTSLKNPILLSKASSSASVRTTMPMVSLRGDKGLPWGIDIAGSYSASTDNPMRVYGGEVRWAFLPGTTVMPAVGIRASGTKLTGVDQLGFTSYGLDISISKGFAIFTPYGGLGEVWVHSSPEGAATGTATNLQAEKFTQTKFFAGVNINLGINFAFEFDNTGSINTYSAKMGVRF
ncbi:MAG TPA: hypothetical protein VMG60_23805 [Burkholderiaceae bacterium]|nr:hypothetical protein [Burkholderiaceae bacterium]